MERGDVREPDHRLRPVRERARAGRDSRKQAQAAVTAARAENAPDGGIAKCPVQLLQAADVRSCEISMLLENIAAISNRVAAFQRGQSRLEARTIKRTRRCDDGDDIAWRECRRLMEN